jgi:hypothetical protein
MVYNSTVSLGSTLDSMSVVASCLLAAKVRYWLRFYRWPSIHRRLPSGRWYVARWQ